MLHAKVTASVNAPGGDIEPFSVTDDGLGADIQRNDGIYSAFLTGFKGEGRYGLSVSYDFNGYIVHDYKIPLLFSKKVKRFISAIYTLQNTPDIICEKVSHNYSIFILA